MQSVATMFGFNLLKREPNAGGQYISFEKSSKMRKSKKRSRSWKTCGGWNNVHRVMGGLDVNNGKDTCSRSGIGGAGHGISSTESTASDGSCNPPKGQQQFYKNEESSTMNMSMSVSTNHCSSSHCAHHSSVASHQRRSTLSHCTPAKIVAPSYHTIMINDTRRRWNVRLQPLQQHSELDALAAAHAAAMAEAQQVFHADPVELCEKLQCLPTTRLGENVAVGTDSLDVHLKVLEKVTNYTNMVDGRYREVGIATARGADGQTYVCQLFRG